MLLNVSYICGDRGRCVLVLVNRCGNLVNRCGNLVNRCDSASYSCGDRGRCVLVLVNRCGSLVNRCGNLVNRCGNGRRFSRDCWVRVRVCAAEDEALQRGML